MLTFDVLQAILLSSSASNKAGLFYARKGARSMFKTNKTVLKIARSGLGLTLVAGIVVAALWGPLPTLAEGGQGGEPSLVSVQGSEMSLTTTKAVQIPVSGYRLTQKFGWFHTGLDMAVPIGTEVRPAMAGKVIKVEWKNWGYGNHVIIDNGNGYETLYGHLSRINVREGQEVTHDTVLGLSGSTGHSTGPHLHFEVRQDGKYIDPKPILGI